MPMESIIKTTMEKKKKKKKGNTNQRKSRLMSDILKTNHLGKGREEGHERRGWGDNMAERMTEANSFPSRKQLLDLCQRAKNRKKKGPEKGEPKREEGKGTEWNNRCLNYTATSTAREKSQKRGGKKREKDDGRKDDPLNVLDGRQATAEEGKKLQKRKREEEEGKKEKDERRVKRAWPRSPPSQWKGRGKKEKGKRCFRRGMKEQKQRKREGKKKKGKSACAMTNVMLQEIEALSRGGKKKKKTSKKKEWGEKWKGTNGNAPLILPAAPHRISAKGGGAQ